MIYLDLVLKRETSSLSVLSSFFFSNMFEYTKSGEKDIFILENCKNFKVSRNVDNFFFF